MPRAANQRRRGVVAAFALLVIALPIAWSQSGPSPSTPSSDEDSSVSSSLAALPPHEAAHAGVELDPGGDLVLPGPTNARWRPALGPGSRRARPPQAPDGFSHRLRVTAAEVDVDNTYGSHIGLLRYGSTVAARPTDAASCRDGDAFEVIGGGFVCTGDGLVALPGPDDRKADKNDDSGEDGDGGAAPPIPTFDARRANPFRYARVIAEPAPVLSRLPADVDEAAALDADVKARARPSGALVSRWLVGDYFAAFARRGTKIGEWTFFRTSTGHYVRERDLEARPLPPMHGERLGGTYRLPLAFVFRDSDLLCERDGALAPCGRAEKHARFNAADPATATHGGTAYVRGPDGIAVAAPDVRLVRATARPEGVPEDARWVHIDLSQQALVAYEGDRPVYATLVSSGARGYETPAGLFQVERKYLSKTMRGKDIDNGRYYEVAEVPWTMYYDGNYAVHGAYWHNRFGMTKSHGCTNVPPVDARWLYYWAELEVPPGWHAVLRQKGTWFYFSGESPPDGQ